MEYTDAPSADAITGDIANTKCPLCGAALPQSAVRCEQCDWTREGQLDIAEGKASDAVAVLLSVIPGLGHIYKGHKMIGLLLMLGSPFAIALALLAATATAGFGLGLMVLYWFGVMFHVYGVEDRVSDSQKDEGEQY